MEGLRLNTRSKGVHGCAFHVFFEGSRDLVVWPYFFFLVFFDKLATNFLSATMNGRTKLLYLIQLFYTRIPVFITDMPQSNPTSIPALVRRVD